MYVRASEGPLGPVFLHIAPLSCAIYRGLALRCNLKEIAAEMTSALSLLLCSLMEENKTENKGLHYQSLSYAS